MDSLSGLHRENGVNPNIKIVLVNLWVHLYLNKNKNPGSPKCNLEVNKSAKELRNDLIKEPCFNSK